MICTEDLIGVPFADGGRDIRKGLDCWGLAMEMFRRQGITVHDYDISAMQTARIADEIKRNEPDWVRINQPKEGCIVLIRIDGSVWANHVGIYLGDGKFIHAYRSTGVCMDRTRRWQSHIVGYYEPRKHNDTNN